jgi:hypothetical protein
MTEADSHRAVLNGLQANGVEITLPPHFVEPGEGGSSGRIRSFDEYESVAKSSSVGESKYNEELQLAIAKVVGKEQVSLIGSDSEYYDQVTKNPQPWAPPKS